MISEACIKLPDWIGNLLTTSPRVFSTVEDRLRFVITLARQNVHRQTGGPFAAAIFDNVGRLITLGVNMVVISNCSILHAEIVALILAQKALNRYDLSDGGRLHYELVSAAEPCAMCFGAITWSGVRRLVCGARDEDVRAIGFDEGPKLDDWASALSDRGITVVRDVLRDEAAAVLQEYVAAGGIIYNSGRPTGPYWE